MVTVREARGQVFGMVANGAITVLAACLETTNSLPCFFSMLVILSAIVVSISLPRIKALSCLAMVACLAWPFSGQHS